jgi:ABC-2 type transport system permease protein
MTLRDMLLHEWRTKLSQPATLISLAAFTLISMFAAVSGGSLRQAREQSIQTHQSQIAAATGSWLADLQDLETNGSQSKVPPWSGSPMDVSFASSLPPAPLADFSIGQSDLMPGIGALSLWDPDIRLFSRYEIEDPVALALGAFDMSKAIIIVLPLLMIVLSFDVLSADRDSGRLGLIVAQGGRMRRVVWGRLFIRCGTVLALALLLAALTLVLNRASVSITSRLLPFGLWCACALLYATFWFALIGHIASRNRRGETNIMWLLVLWTGLTLIVPSVVTAVAEAVYPPPSRLEYLAEARKIEIDTERSEAGVANQFFNDHPEVVVDEQSRMPAYLRTTFFVTSSIDDATRPVLASFDAAAAERDRVLALLGYASPAIIAHRTFNAVGGSSAERHRRYVAQAREFKAAYATEVARHVVAGQRLPLARARVLPRFQSEETTVHALVAGAVPALLFLAFVTCVLLVAADRRLSRLGSHAMATGLRTSP